MSNAKRLPLEGIRVIGFTAAWAGPVSTVLLSDMGAEVIKIENPSSPDPSRGWPPFAEGIRGLNRSGYFATFNRGTKDCVLDLKTTEGIEAVKRLVGISDVVIENFAPRVMDSIGLGYASLKETKPDIIMVSLSGYGATGPNRECVAFGPVLEPYSGLSSLIGYPGGPPMGCGIMISDHVSATLAALCALAALHYRNLTGKGQHIDISEIEAMLACMPESIMEYTVSGRNPIPKGNANEATSPHGCYRCRGQDKWVAIAIGDDTEWQSLCSAMNKPWLAVDGRFSDAFLRCKNREELDKLITSWTSEREQVEVMEKLHTVKISAGPVYSGEDIYRDPHLKARNFFITTEHPETGKRELPGLFAKLTETPGQVKGRAPLFGEHTSWLFNVILNNEVQD